VDRNATPVSRSTTRTPPVVGAPPALGRGLPPLILIADGDAVSRDVREAQLTTAGFRVSVARTGFEAIVKASCHVPDVILLDESVGGIDAEETVRLLRTCPTTSHIPIVPLLPGRRLAQRTLSRLRRVAA
jgi:CheY-like chemotaxis protein